MNRPYSSKPDPLMPNWYSELKKARKHGIVIAKADKTNGFVYTCRCLPNSQLHKEIMLKPGRYAKVHESAKQIRQRLGRKLRKILGARIEIPHEFARLHPTYKTHKQFPNIPMRPVTSYYNRGLAIPQRMLSRVLTEVENFHCFNPKQKQHVLRSSVEFTMLLPETFQQAHTADIVGMFDNLDLDYADMAVGKLLEEMYEAKRAELGQHAHIRLQKYRTIWVRAKPNANDPNHFTLKKTKLLMAFLLRNDYVTALGGLWKSLSGGPMGASSTGKLCSLSCYYGERIALKKIRRIRPDSFLGRFADDTFYTFETLLFKKYLDPELKKAGFTSEHEHVTGRYKSISFLETLVSLLPHPRTEHYSKSHQLFPLAHQLPVKGGCTSRSSNRCQLRNLVRRTYNACSTLEPFAKNLIALGRKHRDYTFYEISQACRHVLDNTRFNRYGLSRLELRHLERCIIERRATLRRHIIHTHIFA